MDFSKPWTEYEFVAFDTETSGAYPLGSEIVEFGAVRWKQGQIVDQYQTLIRPSKPMSDFIIGIHGITNEMVADAPFMKDKIGEIRKFFDGAFLMAHHAPFDLGFVNLEFEKFNIPAPLEPVICTSLLSRKVIHETANHKLQTLIKFLNLDPGSAHRAADDARNCLDVGLECFKRLGETATLQKVFATVEKDLRWSNYSLLSVNNGVIDSIRRAVIEQKHLDISYTTMNAKKAETRRITPIGLVRNPDGDFVMATCHRDGAQKRFYLQKISDIQIVL
jgi:DNA polymerase-3 subunit epsilon